MTICELVSLVEKAAYIYLKLSVDSPAYEAAYKTWHLLEKELREKEAE